jgi:pimeloyl-ACP methyl ester carboxylesterase
MLSFAPHINPVHCHYNDASTLEKMVDDVLVQAPMRSNLVGFSLGGYLGCLAALKEPHKFSSVTIIAATPEGLTESEKDLRLKNADFLMNHPYKRISKHRLRQLVHPNHLKDKKIIDTIFEMEKGFERDALLHQLLAPINRRDISENIRELTIPIQFIMANDDQITSMSKVEKLSKLSSHITMHRISESGHMIPLEAPQKLATLLS